MKKRKIQLATGQTMTINDNEWEAVVNRKEFDAKETEILRITKHNSGLMSRVYAMKSVDGQKVAERNEIVVVDDVNEVARKIIADVGLTKISASDL